MTVFDPARRLLSMLGVAPHARGTLKGSATKAWAVTETDWMKSLSDRDMQLMGQICPPRPFARGERVFRHGDPAGCLYILLEGHVKLAQPTWLGGERVISVCGPDDFFGENFLTGADQCLADAVCLSEPTVVCPVSREQFLEVAARLPNVALTFAMVLARRNADLEAKLHVMTQPVQIRLARVMLELAARLGEEVGEGVYHLKIDLRHDEIASMAGASRVSATQAISAWRTQELVLGTRGDYRVNVPGLAKFIERLELEALE
ncbi:Crp/Fnr family transcriptional regulator [Deinococcus peraridilitoris]|uniref:cAMP-binding protein n=1 Tax=Deinococcus peraridilitoris (strain DSM 19664 / LMG 22246 / CIP 109416 / KR-200) TaxID=937777 RepID=K9ZX65_DEIPD|nr:Crp/Fnr family transcriptional regulator [Deinococcus peraridilitoris]AFZ66243.1 cAMP-binding protein [Deinococcus peraridilitoris DSM 19664]